jgi:hypothetical protein
LHDIKVADQAHLVAASCGEEAAVGAGAVGTLSELLEALGVVADGLTERAVGEATVSVGSGDGLRADAGSGGKEEGGDGELHVEERRKKRLASSDEEVNKQEENR